MLSSIGRAAISRVVSTASVTSSRRITVSWLTATHSKPNRNFVRCFAAPARAKKSSTTTARATKPTATKARTKPAKKTKSRATSKKTTKPKPKTNPTRRRKELTPEKKAILEKRELKKAALFTEPKLLPDSPWKVFFGQWVKERAGNREDVKTKTAGVSQAYKSLSASESQRLASIAEQNKLSNNAAYKAWVESHTPIQIKTAINARQRLKKKYNFPPKKVFKPIRDSRLPKSPTSAYSLFTRARWASGEFGNKTIPEAAKQIGSEWKSLPDTERQSFQDLAKAARDHYVKEVDSVLHRTVRSPEPKA
ncbi:hypothetical protein GGS26DRAFT_586509 [Hypomontagnella submonticulosa]|nr:hypothetical protein GGS26DRAFT_586509 [Hypomontagnella submonticulosa]